MYHHRAVTSVCASCVAPGREPGTVIVQVQLGCFPVGTFATLIAWIITLYMYVLIARIVIEMIQSFSRSFSPPKWFYVIAEPIFMVTDPPVRLLRRIIPPLPLGNIRLDISVIVLFFGLSILRVLVTFIPF